ncbi:MAG TPA: glycosyltransferase [Paludibacteraceae bacterium]|nr:glycosyltransferase [Paludibacteraceae bacterium]
MTNSFVDVIIPTYNPDTKLICLLDALLHQTHQPSHIWILNTQTGNPLESMEGWNESELISVKNIAKEEFDHGATRNLGASFSNADYLLFMTQDAVPSNANLIEHLLQSFSTEGVAVAYARQVAGEDAGDIEQLTRRFNYPEESAVKSLADKEQLGIKTYFCSNVCAMYDRRRFVELGGFPERMIFNEDMLFAAKAINSGCYIAYSAKAEVFHSHRYTCIQQLKRYFDLAVSQKQNPFLFDGVSSEGEGVRLVRYVVSGLAKKGEWAMVPYFIWQSAFKYLGYFSGYRYELLPKSWRKSLSMNRNYWK